MTVSITQIILIIIYLAIVGYLGYLGFRRTNTATDYLVAGRKTHPFIMALSYGATFISTSAIVGFGGVAGMFGLSLLWLTFLNIFVGIFIAFICLGGPTRRMGHRLDAHTFPEFIGRRFQSKFIQIFGGVVIFIFIPLYASAVLIGGCAFISKQFGMSYETALLLFSAIIALYVIMGGLKGVMYTDALQGSIMFIGMLTLLIVTYKVVGGFTAGHEQLVELGKEPNMFAKIGFKGWASMPAFGFGVTEGVKPSNVYYDLWWIIISTITLGVGIGVLAQPQLVVRFMTVKSKKELNRAAMVGGVFILVMTGVAFVVGSLSNVYFLEKEQITGTLLSQTQNTGVIVKRGRGINPPKEGRDPAKPHNPDVVSVPCNLIHLDTTGDKAPDTHLIASTSVAPLVPILPNPEIKVIDEEGNETDTPYADGNRVHVRPKANAYLRAIAKNADGSFECKTSLIIPTYIGSAMPPWFGTLFLLTLLAAAMSTLSSQFHALGTSIGRDVFEQIAPSHRGGIGITRIGIILGIIMAVVISYMNKGGGYIIARATAIFFGLCASTFLPALIAALFWRRATRAGVIISMITGFLVTAFWLLFIKDQEARALGLCFKMTGKHSLLLNHPSWPVVDPILIALPIAALTLIIASLVTKPPKAEHLENCFKK